MKKINLNENELRKIVNRVLRRKLNEDKGMPDPSSEPETKKNKSSTLDTSNIENVVETAGIDGLAGTTNRGQTIGEPIATAAVAGTVAFGVATWSTGALATAASALTPIGLPFAAAAALGAGLYYVFNRDATVGSEAVLQALDTTLYQRVARAFKEMKEQLRKSDDPDVRELASSFSPDKVLANGILGPTEQRKLVDEMYTATQGGFTLGIGTDEDAVSDIIKKCKSYLGVSQLSALHAKKKGGVIDDGNLLKVFRGEFNDDDFDTYVTAPIEELPYIFIGSNSYTKEEFLDWIEDTKIKLDKLISAKKEEKTGGGEGEESIKDYIKEIQKLLNQYCSDKDLDYTPIKPDGAWGPRTNSLWLNPYLPHVFDNHPEFSKLGLKIGNGRWKSISEQLIDKYPGYTSGEVGCYRFCTDALSGDTSLGQLEADPDDKPIKYFGGKKKKGEGGSKEKQDVTPIPVPPSKTKQRRSDGRLDYRDIIIDVDVVGHRNKNAIDSLPGASPGDSKELAYDFLGNFTAGKLNLKNQESFQINIYYKGKDKISVKNAKGTRIFKNMGIRRFKETFTRYFSGLDRAGMEKLGIDKKNPITISIKMPKGVYTAATERLHESMRMRKKVKKILKGS